MPFLGIQNVPDLFGTYIIENKLSRNCNSSIENLWVITICISPNLSYITCWQGIYSRALAVSLLGLSWAVMLSWLTLN